MGKMSQVISVLSKAPVMGKVGDGSLGFVTTSKNTGAGRAHGAAAK